jgi:hypothetical protein
LTAGGCLAVLVLVGCSEGEPAPGAEDSASPTATPDADAAASPVEVPSPVAAIDASMLLPPEDMPPWSGAVDWRQAPQEDLMADAPVCTLPDPQSLGAVASFTATYTGAGTVEGANTIMLFPDESTATAALRTYEQEMPACLEQEGARGLITDDPAASSWTGALACEFTGDPACAGNERLFEFIGLGAQANTMTVVSFHFIGQDANWCMDASMCPDPRDPILPEVYLSLDRIN